jgi:hypothetical protein
MSGFFTWLMVLSVLFGLGARGLALPAGHGVNAAHGIESRCGHDHHHEHSHGDHSHDDKNCPPDHHHGCCAPAMPLTIEKQAVCRLGISGLNLFGQRDESELPPEEPLLSSEKPPLI